VIQLRAMSFRLVSMAAVALAISGGGALSSLETTVLLTVDEADLQGVRVEVAERPLEPADVVGRPSSPA
jgi:hypothetical protein